jgi:hypothetical protein
MIGGAGDDPPRRIRNRHRIGMYARESAWPATVHDDQCYTLFVDVIGGHAPQAVAWPMDAFCTVL